jgi:protein TonB
MKAIAIVALLTAALSAPVLAVQQDDKEERPAPTSLRPISISKAEADKLLIHRVEPVWKHHEMEARVSGTVVLRITVGTKGHVTSSQIISGPLMLQQPVINAVRSWEYKPYLVNGKSVEFSTKVSVTYSNY